ncbi:MAG: hypothetical protein ABJD68_15410 [Nakamurella sp.]
MSWQLAAHAPGSTKSGLFDSGFSWGLVLIGIVAVLALAAVCTFGILARLRDRAADRRSLDALHRAGAPADQVADPTAGQPLDTGGTGPATR